MSGNSMPSVRRAALVGALALLTACQQMPAAPAPTAPNTRQAGQSRLAPEMAPDRLVVKLSPSGGALSATGLAAGASDEAVLAGIRKVAGVKSIRAAFQGAKAPAAARMIQAPGGAAVAEPDLTRWHRIDLEAGADVAAKVAELKAIPGVALAEPDYLRRPSALPNNGSDPLLGQQWHLDAVHAREAWTYLDGLGLPPGGSRDVVVAVIDTGIDLTHPDLAANLWTNTADGSHGYDAITGSHLPQDDHGHGTHVAGIIGAQAGNGLGGVGIAYNVQLMAIKAAQSNGSLSASDIARGLQFAVAHGADVINMSFGGYGKSQIEEDALATAFGSSVLVAAAGNDHAANECTMFPSPMYPAAHNWVLGVMASDATGHLAAFSNWDCYPDTKVEYELMAPGVGIWSSLPGAQHSAWSGTSMSAPLVSGIAALIRTRFPDKNLFSSRLVMGQVASTGPKGDYRQADALAAVSSTPAPQLSFLEQWLFDGPAQAPTNIPNGRIDAGETVEFGIVIRNHWGKADDAVVTVVPWDEAGARPDPLVTVDVGSVSYGSIGSFGEVDNGFQRDAQGAITGVRSPFRFTIDPGAPNDHAITFRVTISARNGLDPSDPTTYTSSAQFILHVQNGRALPREIAQDMTLTKDHLWLVAGQVLINKGVTLTVAPGAKLNWYFRWADCLYCTGGFPELVVDGSLVVAGTEAEPVELAAQGEDGFPVKITNYGTATIQYANINYLQFGNANDYNPLYGPTWIDHANFGTRYTSIAGGRISNSVFRKTEGGVLRPTQLDTVLLDSTGLSDLGPRLTSISSSVLLLNRIYGNSHYISLGDRPRYPDAASAAADPFAQDNAFLNAWWSTSRSSWLYFRANNCYGDRYSYVGLANNYWGTTSDTLIGTSIQDYGWDLQCPHVVHRPLLETPPVSAFPFVADVEVRNAAGAKVAVVGPEKVDFVVTYNRDMDATVQPQVTFGPAVPMTDYVIAPVNGGWSDARTWVGTFTITPMTGDGYHLLRIVGGRAADDHWFVAGDDAGRFRFQVLTSGAESMNLQATGAEGRVDLSWTQTDFDLLAGYHLYRSTSATGTYVRVNPTLVPPQQKAYTDPAVAPGQPYFYKFTVVKTDMTESDFSNVATATPLDTIAPVISHSPVTSAPAGLPLSLSAVATDNVAVQAVDLYVRTIGSATYARRSMIRTTGDAYVATIEGSAIVAPGLEYYLSATDGISTVTSGRPEYAYQVLVVDRPVLTSLTPARGPAGGGTQVTIAGSNFKAGATVTFGGAAADGVVVAGSSQITCTTPVHFPAGVDVVVTNPDGQTGSLLRAFTFESDVASLSLPALEAGQYAIVTAPINASAIAGLVAADLTVAYDPAVLTIRGARSGTLTTGWTLVANTATPGEARLSMVSPGGGVTGSGTLANLDFELVGAPGTSSALALASASLNGGAIPSSSAPGSIHVQAVCSVSGTVRSWSGGAGIPGVQLLLAGERLHATQSDAAGAFTVGGASPGAYSLRPSKTDGVGGITAYDASLVLQHAAGLALLSGDPAQAADVDKSGTIDAMDAYYILQAASGLLAPPFPGAGVIWEFSPAVRTYASLGGDLSSQDFTGLLLGDVSGNWTSASVQGGASVGLRVSELPPAADGAIDAVLIASPGGQPVYSLDLVLTYDPTRGAPALVAGDEAAPGWVVASNASRAGELRVSLAGASPISTEGQVLALRFATAGGAQDVALQVRSVAINEALAADVAYRLTREHAVMAARIAAGAVSPTPAQVAKYDVGPVRGGATSPDGAVDVEDVVWVLRQASGLQ